MRIDRYMAENGLAVSRAKAQEILKSGAVTVNGRPINKPAFEVDAEDSVCVADTEVTRYVSRGGLKLEAALDAFALSPKGQIALDVGASSGGFTDCLLRRGAAFVYAVDSGSDQLHPTLRADGRVCSMENCNARALTQSAFARIPRFSVMDVSFISQTLILPAILSVMTEGGVLVSLVKPQFELGRAALGKSGVVKSEKDAKRALSDVCTFAQTLGYRLIGTIPSPIRGGDGNLEFLAAFLVPSLEERSKNDG